MNKVYLILGSLLATQVVRGDELNSGIPLGFLLQLLWFFYDFAWISTILWWAS